MADAQPQRQLSGYLAEIVEINMKAKTGIYGEIYSVSCRILEGKDKGRIIRRNMLGPAKVGDIIRLPDTSREAKEIRVK
ncbi:MAG: 30S ribosomal protein S28e [Candidatus Marsarchaeota archaeon]|jgi:small subunit ribosomal protein S28e|nr:30S ribosomal protein S28e [Candidatus Marsarchaeota archaeon]MCL5111440.1 30S ribosomal protein S28e [Candidatus Marsarchaeota archaeon]